ncbi:SDR family oxidoreductase [Aquipseudomonas alcaligenes]|uniref:Peroxisomal trans-2-enoyl-CoA reductase n=1 Tax=Aquipseudomonas alcaligenes (strain ATCC 14909 / DSM 50342 / CCUG 1425 / JCM 20561 / NBRC 14159 / NCIMB 9945 / NCTC 10367 / 1577) TaxID=1215092 RepID=U3AV79_AQUA1|nr:SDR family oxidoreductase [Pseudomonas alcaligenes]GAD61574.1 putative oxidoreductase [Pseudomonas alcaligenes NBRC 14159]SUD14851.1 short-chain dehydrogenase/reductase SDR [Pseudomonas alcaligenes]
MAYDSVFKPGLFAGQTILVTGGGSGIGRCVAHELAYLGAHVVLVGRKLEKLESTCAEIVEDGGSASFKVCDIREEDAVKAMVAQVLAERERIHHLVNNAGGQFPAPLISINQKGFETVVRTNLVGGFLVAREVFTQSLCKHGGSIVNMLADMWGGMPGMGHSGAARAGMENFTKTAAFEWGHCNVRVNAVAPGWIASSGMDTYPESMKSLIRNLKEHVPLQRIGTESEVAAAIVFLLSPGANFINGNTIRIDGAASLGTRAWPLAKAKKSESYNGFHRAYMPDVFKE